MAATPAYAHLSSLVRFRRQPKKFEPRKSSDTHILNTRCSLEEFPFNEGPLEPARPKFSRDPHTDLSFVPITESTTAPLKGPGIKIGRRRRNRPWKKTTPAQAVVGSVVGGFWAVIAHKATMLGYEHLQDHPVTRDLPMGLTNSVNSLLVSAVTGFGWLATGLFGVSSFGLALLAVKLLTAPKSPPVQ